MSPAASFQARAIRSGGRAAMHSHPGKNHLGSKLIEYQPTQAAADAQGRRSLFLPAGGTRARTSDGTRRSRHMRRKGSVAWWSRDFAAESDPLPDPRSKRLNRVSDIAMSGDAFSARDDAAARSSDFLAAEAHASDPRSWRRRPGDGVESRTAPDRGEPCLEVVLFDFWTILHHWLARFRRTRVSQNSGKGSP